MKTALMIVVYPQVLRYMSDLISTLEKQTISNYDVLLINDGVDERIVRRYFKNFEIKLIPAKGTIAGNRECGISYAKSHAYDNLIFCDADDYYMPNRIEHSIEVLKDYDIYVNDWELIDEKGNLIIDNYISKSLSKNNTIIDMDMIKERNFMGFTNTAIRLDAIEEIHIPEIINVVDWYIYTVLMLNQKSAYFDNATISYYRQYDNNIAGLIIRDIDQFRKQLEIKIKHYEQFLKVAEYKKLYYKYNKMLLLNDQDILQILSIQKNYPLWWENVEYKQLTNR